MIRRIAGPLAALGGVLALTGCTVVPEGGAGNVAMSQVATRQPTPPIPAPAPVPPPLPPARFSYAGELTQGGWIKGIAPVGVESLKLNGIDLAFDENGAFFAAFDRDAGSVATLVAIRSDGSRLTEALTIAPRDWRIERVNIARRAGGPTAAFMAIRRPELDRINAARAVRSASEGWRQDFIWPARGRISGVFGSQRIYRGEPGSYHSGIDIAPGAGEPFVAPADGMVVLATETPFSLEGNLLIVDHGMGLNSAFLHASRLDVREGDRVRQGQQLGLIGATGRATGPHLHWSIKWEDARLDPILFTGPMRGE